MGMRVAVVSRDPRAERAAIAGLRDAGLTHVGEARPHVVLCYGGDGTFLSAERMYPGVPKLLIRNSKIGKLCENAPLEEALIALRERRFAIEVCAKLKATVRDRELVGVNDIVVRNTLPTYALRFRLVAGNRYFLDELIGDGIVVATAFGSSAYFYSIARQTFASGLGIAFNNLTNPTEPLLLGDDERIELTISRGDAVLAGDNDPNCVHAKAGDTILISRSEEVARIIRLRHVRPAVARFESRSICAILGSG